MDAFSTAVVIKALAMLMPLLQHQELLAGLEAMCQWLRARLFVTDFRPVPLQEYAVFGGQVHSKVRLLTMDANRHLQHLYSMCACWDELWPHCPSVVVILLEIQHALC